MDVRGAGPPLTQQVLYDLSDDECSYELQAGVLLSEPRPAPRHGWVQARLAKILASFVDERRLGAVFTDAGFRLAENPDTVRGPDVAFVSTDGLSALHDPSRFFPGAPGLAVEIVSPSNRREEIHAKVADYLAAGSRLVWVVDPDAKSIDVYRTLLSPRRLGADATLEGEDVLPGFATPATLLFEF